MLRMELVLIIMVMMEFVSNKVGTNHILATGRNAPYAISRAALHFRFYARTRSPGRIESWLIILYEKEAEA